MPLDAARVGIFVRRPYSATPADHSKRLTLIPPDAVKSRQEPWEGGKYVVALGMSGDNRIE
jgi:hypothetical protein